MRREMMGMPSEEDNEEKGPESSAAKLGKSRIEELDSDDEEGDEDETSQIQKVMQRMEAELNEAGALNLDPTPSKLTALKGKGTSAKEANSTEKEDWEDESDDEDVNIDFNLAKNLLERFLRIHIQYADFAVLNIKVLDTFADGL